jgi:hypothetical protein
MQSSKTAATAIMAVGSEPSTRGPVDDAIARQRKLILEYRGLRASSCSLIACKLACLFAL